MNLFHILIAGALTASFLFSLPEYAFASADASSYRIVYDDAYDDATLYHLLQEKYQSAASSPDAEVHEDASSLLKSYVLRSHSQVEYLIDHGDFIEDIVIFHRSGKKGTLAKVRQLAYENGENYISSYYLK